jgi:hypothetical protein
MREALMRRKRLAILSGTLVVMLILASIGYRWYEESEETAAEPEFPAALGRHLERLREASPGNIKEEREGPWSAGEAEFVARAYPADTISVAQMDAARAAFSNAKGRPFPTG